MLDLVLLKAHTFTSILHTIALKSPALLHLVSHLLRADGRFIDQRRKEQERIILITIVNTEVALMQM